MEDVCDEVARPARAERVVDDNKRRGDIARAKQRAEVYNLLCAARVRCAEGLDSGLVGKHDEVGGRGAIGPRILRAQLGLSLSLRLTQLVNGMAADTEATVTKLLTLLNVSAAKSTSKRRRTDLTSSVKLGGAGAQSKLAASTPKPSNEVPAQEKRSPSPFEVDEPESSSKAGSHDLL